MVMVLWRTLKRDDSQQLKGLTNSLDLNGEVRKTTLVGKEGAD